MVRVIFCIFLIIISISCGKQHFPDYDEDTTPERMEEEEGIFRAEFNSLNPHYSGKIIAKSDMWTRGIQFYAKVVMERAPARTRYLQYIHKGPECPDQGDDLNRDGEIDMFEVIARSGEMIIPLDKKLVSQDAGHEWFPVTDKHGAYYYSRSGDIDDILNDLYAPDKFPDDGIGKLERNESLSLDQRVIVLYGSPSDPFLPVACAVINEILH